LHGPSKGDPKRQVAGSAFVHGVFINLTGDFQHNDKSVPGIIQPLWNQCWPAPGAAMPGIGLLSGFFMARDAPPAVAACRLSRIIIARQDVG
jgi:hypothetical protein